jgi:hypothetical protein
MRGLAAFLQIEYDPVLATPTFNGYPVGANSSYEVRTTGVLTDPLERHKELLSDEQRERILGECEALHKEALGVVDRKAAPRSRSSSKGASRPRASSAGKGKGSTTRKSASSRAGAKGKSSTTRKTSSSSTR